MSRRVELRGKSGRSYAFTRLDGETFLRQIGVTYAIAAVVDGRWHALRIGETNNLADQSWERPLREAREQQPSAECLIRLNVSRSIREAELSDISGAMTGSDQGEEAP